MKAGKPPPRTSQQVASLVDFALARRREERRRACAVCRLPDEVRAQLRAARDRKIDTRTRLEWLREVGHPVTEVELKAHGSSGHDAGLEDGGAM